MSRFYHCEVIPDRAWDPAYPEDRVFIYLPKIVGERVVLPVGAKGASEGGALVFRRIARPVWTKVLLGHFVVPTREVFSVGFDKERMWSLSVSFSDPPLSSSYYDPVAKPFVGAWPDLDEVFIWVDNSEDSHTARFIVGGRAEYEESVRKGIERIRG